MSIKSKMNFWLCLIATTFLSVLSHGQTWESKRLNLFDRSNSQDLELFLILNFSNNSVECIVKNTSAVNVEMLVDGLAMNCLVYLGPDGKIRGDYCSPRLKPEDAEKLKMQLKPGEKKLLRKYTFESFIQAITKATNAADGVYKCMWVIELKQGENKHLFHSNILLINYKKTRQQQ